MYKEKLYPDQSGNGFVLEDIKKTAVQRILQVEHGIDGRAEDLLRRSFVCNSREAQVRTALTQGSFLFDTQNQRRWIEEILVNTSSEVGNPLMENKTLWNAGDLLSFNYLNHTISGEKGKMLEDAQVCYLLTALSLAFWGRNAKVTYAKRINSLPMEKVAKAAASAGNWDELALVARKFAESQLARRIHSIVNVEKLNFEQDQGLKRIMNRLIETYAVMKNPDEIMKAALEIYETIYEVNLRPASADKTL